MCAAAEGIMPSWKFDAYERCPVERGHGSVDGIIYWESGDGNNFRVSAYELSAFTDASVMYLSSLRNAMRLHSRNKR